MTDTAAAEQSEREKIWAELDATDAGKPADAVDTPAVEEPAKSQAAAEPAEKPDAKADDSQVAAPAQAADASTPTVTAEQQTLLDKINGLESLLTQTNGRLRNVEGRYGELKAATNAARESAAAGAAAPSAREIQAAQASPVAMEKLKKDYPEFGAAMEAALEGSLSGVRDELKQLRQDLQKANSGVMTTAEAEHLRADLSVERVHAGWKETVRQPEFAGWKNRQPREVQLLAESDSPQDAIRMLDLYVESRKAAKPNSGRLEAAAAIPGGKGAAGSRTKSLEDMSREELWAYYDQQEAQQNSRQG